MVNNHSLFVCLFFPSYKWPDLETSTTRNKYISEKERNALLHMHQSLLHLCNISGPQALNHTHCWDADVDADVGIAKQCPILLKICFPLKN